MTKTYNPDLAFTLELNGIDGQPLYNDDNTPMTVDLLGRDSDVAVATTQAQQDRRFSQMGQGVKYSAEDQKADGTTFLSKVCTGWNITPAKLIPGVDPGVGEGKVAFSPAAATKVFGNTKLQIIRDQVDYGIGTRANFMRA